MKKLNIWALSKEYVDEMSSIDSSVQYPNQIMVKMNNTIY